LERRGEERREEERAMGEVANRSNWKHKTFLGENLALLEPRHWQMQNQVASGT
jgi:hypothetical protein